MRPMLSVLVSLALTTTALADPLVAGDGQPAAESLDVSGAGQVVPEAELVSALTDRSGGVPTTIVLFGDAFTVLAPKIFEFFPVVRGEVLTARPSTACVVEVRVADGGYLLAADDCAASAEPVAEGEPVSEPVAEGEPVSEPVAEGERVSEHVGLDAPQPTVAEAAAVERAPVVVPVAEAPAPVLPAEPVPAPVPTSLEDRPVLLDAKSQHRGEGDDALIAFGVLYGGFAGAETGYLIGESLETHELGHTTQGPLLGSLTGVAVGSSMTFMLSRRRAYSAEEVGLLYSGAGLGGLYGFELGRALIPIGDDGELERMHAAALAGSMGGVGIAALTAPGARSIRDQTRFALATAVGWQAGLGAADMMPLRHRKDLDGDGQRESLVTGNRQWHAASGLIGAGLFGALGATANRVGVEAPTPTTVGLSLGHGAWIGGWSPLLFTDDPSTKHTVGGLRLGTGLGYASALGMSALGQPSPRSAGLQTAGWAAGSALGAGIPMSLGRTPHARGTIGPMLAGGIGGQVVGALVAPSYDEFDESDAALMGVLTSWTAYQSLGWGLYAATSEEQVSTRPLGHALAAAGAGSLVTISMAPSLDIDPSGSIMLLSAGGWGSWGGAWGSQLFGANEDQVWMATLASGNGALLAAGLVQGLGWNPDWRQVGVINGMGLLGTAAGGMFGVIALYDPADWRPLIASTLSGSALGLGAGAVLASRPGRRSGRTVSLPRVPGLDGVAARVSAQPWMDDAGNPGAWVQIDLTEVVD